MDNEILKLVLDNNTAGISNPKTRDAQIKLWKKFIGKWNAMHSMTKVPLKELADEIHLKWPQMYISLSDNELYCSFSYVDYLFHNNAQGQICGGMFIRGGEEPTDVLNMTSSQIIDLIGIPREPFPMRRSILWRCLCHAWFRQRG